MDTQDNVSNAWNKRIRIVPHICVIVGFLAIVIAFVWLDHGPPTPQTPFVQVCPQEVFDSTYGICRNGQPSTLSLVGFDDYVLVVNNGYAFGSDTLQYRVYKSGACGEQLYGTATDSDINPRWKAFYTSLQDFWDYLTLANSTSSAPTPPDPGQYRIEVLDYAGHHLTETRLNCR